MAVINGPVKCLIGSPGHEEGRTSSLEKLHHRVIPERFHRDHRSHGEQFDRFRQTLGTRVTFTQKYAPEPDCPQISVSFMLVAGYCRWLSEQEGLSEDQMCYPPIDEIKDGIRLPDDYLRRTGYRLPTEAEWECVCRGGTTTSRYFGESDTLLSEHAWWSGNSEARTARRAPSDRTPWGCSTSTVISEWCSDEYHSSYSVGSRSNPPVDSVIEPILRARIDESPGVASSRLSVALCGQHRGSGALGTGSGHFDRFSPC